MLSRRRFIRGFGTATALLAGGCRKSDVGAAPTTAPTAAAVEERPSPGKPSILILGGTGFLGPHFVREATTRGYEVTLFNRGKTNAHLFPELEKIHGDRDGALGPLEKLVSAGRRWDAVMDTSGYVPRIVRASVELLSRAADRYVFISSISVYGDPSRPNLDESGAVGTLEDPSVEKVDGETYGPLKALCEQASEEVFGEAATVIRPGLIVGPGDPTDRFTYWPVRGARGGDLIAPGRPEDPSQIIDARDLATFMVDCIEHGYGGRYNATGPAERLAIGDIIESSIRTSGSDGHPVWIDAAFLEKHEVAPWMHMPAWVPPEGEGGGIMQVDVDRAIGKGLKFRPLDDTVRDTLRWWNELPEERRARPRAGLPAEKELEVLAAWNRAQGRGRAGKRKAA